MARSWSLINLSLSLSPCVFLFDSLIVRTIFAYTSTLCELAKEGLAIVIYIVANCHELVRISKWPIAQLKSDCFPSRYYQLHQRAIDHAILQARWMQFNNNRYNYTNTGWGHWTGSFTMSGYYWSVDREHDHDEHMIKNIKTAKKKKKKTFEK